MQWDDWRELRLEAEDSAAFRKRVHSLAKRLAEIGQAIDAKEISAPEGATREEEPDDAPGVFELIAEAEEAFPRFNESLDRLTTEMETLGEVADVWNPRLERAAGQGSPKLLFAIREFSKAIDGPAERIEALGKQWASDLLTIDPAMLSVIRLAETGRWDQDDAPPLFDSIIEMAAAAREGLGQIRSMTETFSDLETLSRDLRKPLRRMREGLQNLLDGQAVIDEWARRVLQVRQTSSQEEDAA
jgi:hypothetical protein